MPLTIEERMIPVTKIRPGAIIKITYTKKDGSVGEYLMMVIDAFRKNAHAREPQIHGYLINEMTESEFINFIVSLNCPIALDPTNAELSVVDLSNTEAYAAKSLVSTYTNRPYRTFNVSGISTVMEAVINLPSELDQTIDSVVYINDRGSKRRVLQALYEGDMDVLKTVPEIVRVMVSERDEQVTATVERGEREIQQTRSFVSLRQLFNSIRNFIGLGG